MSFIVGLGKYLCVQFVTDWLSGVDMLRLDSALCNVKFRLVYLDWLGEYSDRIMPIQVSKSIHLLNLTKVIHWSKKRNFDVSRVVGQVEVNDVSLAALVEEVDLFNECCVNAIVIEKLLFRIHNHDPALLFVTLELLSVCHHIKGLQLRRAPNSMYEYVANKFTNLTSIDFYGCYDKFEEKTFVRVLRNNPGLTDINLGLCLVTGDFINALIVYCRQITKLSLPFCSQVSKCARFKLALHGCLNLEALEVNQFQSLQLRCLFHYQRTSRLKHVNFTGSDNIYLDNSCPNIENLNLKDGGVLTVDAITAICALQHLEILNLEQMLSITASVVMKIASECKSLHTLKFYNTETHFDCSALELLGKVCPSLTSLYLVRINSLNDSALLGIFSNGQSFKDLALGSNWHLTDAAFEQGLVFLKSLRVLKIDGCRRLTDSTLRTAQQYCKKLEELDIRMCIRMSVDTVQCLDSMVKVVV